MAKARPRIELPPKQYGIMGWCSTNDHSNCQVFAETIECNCQCHERKEHDE